MERFLTPKQLEVLSYMAQGFRNKEIAHKMGISISTVKLHVGGIYLRLQVDTRVAAILKAQKMGLVYIPN